MAEEKTRKVYVLGSDPAHRQSLVALLATDRGYEVADFESSGDFLGGIDAHRPGCVVLALTPLRIDGFQVLDDLQQRYPGLPVVLVSNEPCLSRTLQAVRDGTVMLHADAGSRIPAGLLAAVDRAFSIGAVTTTDVLIEMRREELMSKLSKRECDVLSLLLKGLQNKAIAFELGISPRTVEVHRSRMMRRLSVTSFAELIKHAIEAGFGSE